LSIDEEFGAEVGRTPVDGDEGMGNLHGAGEVRTCTGSDDWGGESVKRTVVLIPGLIVARGGPGAGASCPRTVAKSKEKKIQETGFTRSANPHSLPKASGGSGRARLRSKKNASGTELAV
jgi:hypothetical protein